MRGVKLGIGLGPGTRGFPTGKELIAFGRASEELGFEHFWANDHLSWAHPLVDPIVLLSSVAAVTTRIGLATGVYLLPLRSPAMTARAFASLDYISGGRAILGIGVGGEFEPDFSAAGVPVRERGRRTDVTIGLIRQLWTGKSVDHRDEYFDYQSVQVQPSPVQDRIPIIAGGRSDAALRRAATLADGWMPYLMSPSRIADGIRRLDVLSGGRPTRVIAHVFAYFGDNPTGARQSAIEYLSAQYHRDMEATVDRSVACGPPEVVLETLGRYVDSGVTDIVLRPLAEANEHRRVLEESAAYVSANWSTINEDGT